MAERLKWCLDHRDEDWRHVIFSDETSVQLGGVRGRRRVLRKKEETFHKHVIQRRWKGFSEFMWWSCFSYYEKGPYHIWEPETLAEKKAYVIAVELESNRRDCNTMEKQRGRR
jgi:hypothetical protein